MATSSVTYTAAERRTVDAGWFALKRAVERSYKQESRVDFALKSRKRGGVPHLSARAFILRTVQGAQRQLGPDQVHYLSMCEDDEVLCYFVGAWIKNRTESGQYPSAVWDDIAAALTAHEAASARFLKSL